MISSQTDQGQIPPPPCSSCGVFSKSFRLSDLLFANHKLDLVVGKGPAQKLVIPPGNACTVPRAVWGEFAVGRFPVLSVCGLMEPFSYLHVKEGLNFTKHSLSLFLRRKCEPRSGPEEY